MDLFNTKKIARLEKALNDNDITIGEHNKTIEALKHDFLSLFASLMELRYPNIYKALITNTGNIKRVDINTVIFNDDKTMPIKAVEAMLTPKRTRKGKEHGNPDPEFRFNVSKELAESLAEKVAE